MNTLLRHFATTDWHYWHVRLRPALLIYFFYYGSTKYSFLQPIQTNGQCCGHVVTKKSEFVALGKKAWEAFEKDSGMVLRFMKKMYGQNQTNRQKWRKLLTVDFSKYANTKLSDEYQKYVNDLFAFVPSTYFPLCMETKLTEECKKRLTLEQYNVVMTPVQETDVIAERKSLLKMALKKKQKKSLAADMKKHVEQFSFLKKKDMFMEFYDEADYLKKIESCANPEIELKRFESESQNKKTAFKKVLDAFKHDTFAQNLFKTANEAVFFRSWRTERYSQSTYYMVQLFSEIAKRLELETYRDVIWLLPPEVTALLQKNKLADNELIKQRKEAFMFVTFGADILIQQGKDARETLKYLKLPDATSSEVTGMPAYPGKVTGKVTLITNRSEWQRIPNAEILVIHTTTPDVVPFLKNVKAIVTEEGGILSHASVISRELKIPCVIGTRTATKVLKTGDIVEVDANSGTVRKL